MKLLALILPLFLTGCGLSARDVAVVSANETREFGSQEHDTIESFCVPRYKAAQTTKDVDQVDKLCQPAKVSRTSSRVAGIAQPSSTQSLVAARPTQLSTLPERRV